MKIIWAMFRRGEHWNAQEQTISNCVQFGCFESVLDATESSQFEFHR